MIALPSVDDRWWGEIAREADIRHPAEDGEKFLNRLSVQVATIEHVQV
jgi:hypothetical protein